MQKGAVSTNVIKVLNYLERHRTASALEMHYALGMSERTVYRAIQALRAKGYRIGGQSGVGYFFPQWQPPRTKVILSPERLEYLLIELVGTVSEYMEMPCESLEERMEVTLKHIKYELGV